MQFQLVYKRPIRATYEFSSSLKLFVKQNRILISEHTKNEIIRKEITFETATKIHHEKMKPLETTQRCLIWLCMCYPTCDESTTARNKWHKIFTIAVLTNQIISMMANFAFCFKFISIDVARCLSAFMCCAAESVLIYMFITAMILIRPKMNNIFKDLTSIYSTRKNFSS